MTGFLTLRHVLKALAEENERLAKEGKKYRLPVNRTSVIGYEKAGIIDSPERTMIYQNREDRLYEPEEVTKIVGQMREYIESKTK